MLVDPQAPWQPKKVIGGRFTLLGRLAFGGMAEVWLARQSGPQGFNRMVVVKRVLEARAQEPEIVEMFIEEARLGAQLGHPNIVQTVDFGEDGGVPFIVLEYLFGETLGQLLRTCHKKGKALPMSLAARIVSDAALGLSSAHELKGLDGKPLGIVHRDVSPQNVVVTYDGLVKVLDFGIARSVNRLRHTDLTQVRGRVMYMSPEQISAAPLDQRADVFALGVLLWESVTGQQMYPQSEQPDAVAVMRVLSGDEPLPSAKKVNPAVPAELERIIAHAIEKRRERRYATSAQLHADLEAFNRTQAEPPTQARLGALMAELFSDRQQERSEVLQRLATGTVTPKWTTSMVDALAPPRALATSTRTAAQPKLQTNVAPVPRRSTTVKRPVIAAAVLLVLAALSVGYAMTRTPEVTRVAPEAQPQAVAPVPAEPAIVLREPAPAPAPAPVPVAVPTPVTTTATGPTPAKTRAAKSTGKLRLDSEPWTRVYLNGKKLGDTPLFDVKVPSGQLELLLVNEERQIRTVIDVEITPGETTSKRLHF